MINTKKLEQEILELKNKIEHTPSKTERTYLNITLLRLNELLHSIKDVDVDTLLLGKDIMLLEKKSYMIRDNEDSHFIDDEYIKFIRKLCKNALKELSTNDDKCYFKPRISLNEAKDIIKDFINSYDYTLMPVVEKCLSDENLFIIYNKNDDDGYSHFNPYTNTPYIVLHAKEEKLPVYTMVCLLHEIGHIIHFYKANNRPKLFNTVLYDSLLESPSMTFTMLFIDYLLKNKIYEKDSSKSFNNELQYLKRILEYLKVTNLIIKDIVFKNVVDMWEIEETLLSKGLIVESGLEACIEQYPLNYEYGLGGLLSFYFLDKYRIDPEKTKKDFDSFINSIGTQNDSYMFTHFGISMNEFINCEYLKKAVEENNKRLGQFKI